MGITWDAQEDVLKFTGPKTDAGTTMRNISIQAFSVWDPQGRLLPFSIRSKIIPQNLNRMKYKKNYELKEADLREWSKWHKEAGELDGVKVPGALVGEDKIFRKNTLHVLCDASQEAKWHMCVPKERVWR